MVHEIESLSDLTMIFISRNRQELVLRNARFYESLGASVVILDGSDFPIHDDQYDLARDKFTYLHSPTSLESRFKLARGLSKSTFTIVSSDDDLLVPSGLKIAMGFLAANPKILSCSGRVVGFSEQRKNTELHNCYEEFDNEELQNMSLRKIPRILNYFFNFSSRYFYAVYRTSDWEEIFASSKNIQPLSRNYFELAVEFRASCRGANYTLDNLFWLRNFDNPPLRLGERYKNLPNLVDLKTIFSHVFQTTSYAVNRKKNYLILENYLVFGMIFSLDILNLVRLVRRKLTSPSRNVTPTDNLSVGLDRLDFMLKRKNAIGTASEINQLLRLN